MKNMNELVLNAQYELRHELEEKIEWFLNGMLETDDTTELDNMQIKLDNINKDILVLEKYLRF